jgi:hydrophobic/amphiphilic exporter-1 (mainly G- bacteria), HAE1 family
LPGVTVSFNLKPGVALGDATRFVEDSILVSGFVSLTLTPMLCSCFLKHTEKEKHGRFYNASEKVFDSWLKGYDWSLKRVLRHRFVTLLMSFAIIGLTYYLFTQSKTGFIPEPVS